MKKIFTAIALISMMVLSSLFVQAQTVIPVIGDITSNTTWTANNIYLLNGFVYVKNGAELTIQPGTVIKGDRNTKGTLIITKGAKIIANGTASQPIVFTSNEPIGQRTYGDWGGLILLGKAPINVAGGVGIIEGGVNNMNGDGEYGGNDPIDNSGSLQYVRIEFPGIAFQPNSEINGLTCGGVGAGTTMDYIMVSYSGDDSYEFFGGTVNAKHLIAYRGLDDDFDTDFGYSGMIQFAFSVRDPNAADVSGSNGFESDNDATGSSNLPFTQPIFSNVTLVGPKETSASTFNANYKRAAHIRRNSKCSIYNSVMMGFPVGLLIDGAGCEANADANELQIENVFLCGNDAQLAVANGSTWDITNFFSAAQRNNMLYANTSDAMLTNAFNLAGPNIAPMANSPLLTAGAFTNPRLTNAFFTPVSFAGAMDGITDWSAQWSNWDPNNTTASISTNNNSSSGFQIFPNPAKGDLSLNVKSGNNATITVYDVAGVKVFENNYNANELTNTIIISTSTWANGSYTVKMNDGTNTFFNKVFVIK
nr:T9SS type A sorting domain-containing protein [Bacteroidota bacterium]